MAFLFGGNLAGNVTLSKGQNKKQKKLFLVTYLLCIFINYNLNTKQKHQKKQKQKETLMFAV